MNALPMANKDLLTIFEQQQNRRKKKMDFQNETGQTPDASSSSVGDTAKRADKALRDTAQRYLRSTGVKVDLSKVEKSISEKPLSSAAIAAAAGFVIGGGLATRPGLAMLGFLGWRAAKLTAANFITDMVVTSTH